MFQRVGAECLHSKNIFYIFKRVGFVQRVMRSTLTSKLTWVFISFAAMVLLGVNAIGYYKAHSALSEAAIKELEATAGEKEAAVTAWMQEKQAHVVALSVSPTILQVVRSLRAAPPGSPERERIHNGILAEFKPHVVSGEFLDLFLLHPATGEVILAVETGREGLVKADRAYFREGKNGPFITYIYTSPELQSPTLVASAPVVGEGGELLAVLAGRLSPDHLSKIMYRRSGLRETDDAFLANSMGLVVTQPRFLPDPAVLQQRINTLPVTLCLQQKSGTVFANDYRNVPVIAAYRWLPEQQLCLIVKISQSEILAPIKVFSQNMIWIGLVILGVATSVAHALSRMLVNPIRSMQVVAQRYGRGDLDVRLPENRKDELGVLAHEFNQMAASLAAKELEINDHARTLEHNVQERTKALQESNIQLQRAEEIGQVGSWEWDVPANRMAISDGLHRLLGPAAREFGAGLGSFFRFVHPQDLEKVQNILENALQEGGPFAVECRVVPSDGQVRTLYARGESVLDAQGKPLRLNGVAIDITERKQTELELMYALEFTEQILTSSPVGIFTYKLSGECLSVNAAAAQMVGGSPDQLRAQNFHQIKSWKQSGLYEMAKETISTGSSAGGDVHVLTSFGRDAWYAAQFALFRSHEEDLLLMLFTDITERKQAAQALQEKERLLSDAQRIGRIGSWSYDISSDTLTFSDEMYRLLDIMPEEFRHNREDFLALVYPSDRSLTSKWMDDIREGTQAKDLSFRVFHKNGELCYLHCTGAVEFDASAKAARFIGTAQDITERRAAEMQINQQLKRLTALSEIDRAIVSSLDQRYILRVILSNVISQLQVDAAAVLVLDPEGDGLDYVAGQGFRTKIMEGTHVPLGEVHAGRAAKERRMIRIPDLRECTNSVPFNAFVKAEGFVSYVSVPLIVKRQVKGVLEVFQRSTLQPYQDWLDFFNALAGQTAIAIENISLLTNLQSSNQDLTQAYDATIEGWSRAMDLRDRETEGHTQRVTQLALELARRMGIEEFRWTHIRRGALLHDIGKLGVPDHILFKPGELTAEERKWIERHVEFAYDMLAPIPYLKPALNIPYFHHEKWDGTGYPLGIKGEQIPLEARIFAVVDVWDALLSDRPHRKAWARQPAMEYIRAQAGIQFDPHVVDCFLELINLTS